MNDLINGAIDDLFKDGRQPTPGEVRLALEIIVKAGAAEAIEIISDAYENYDISPCGRKWELKAQEFLKKNEG